MANQMTPEEIQQIMDEWATAQKTGTGVSAELAARMKDASIGVKGYANAQQAAIKALGKSITDYTKAMYRGEQGAEKLADGVETTTSALGGLLVVLGVLNPALAVAGVALIAFGKGTKLAAEQSDKLFKTYKDLSEAGLATAGGMTEVFNSMQKFGYGIEQLSEMTALLKENSKELATFGGTAASGARAFADVAEQIQRGSFGKSLQMLGKTPDEINRGVANFVRQQQMQGVSSAEIQRNLANQSYEYIKNLDIMSKLTGESADQLQAKLEQANAEDAFNATQYELKQKAAAGDRDAATKYAANQELAQRLTGTALKEFQQGVGGDIGAMSKTLMTASGAVAVLGKTSYTADEYIDALAKGSIQARQNFNTLGKFNATQDFILPLHELGQAQSRYATETAQQQKDRAKAEQELQLKGLDPATKAQVQLRLGQMQARDSLQSFVNLGVNPATQGLELLGKVAVGASKLVPGGPGTAMGGGSNALGGGLMNFFGKTKPGVGASGNADTAMKFFMAAGYTKEQAAGLVGNLQAESGKNLDVNAVGDGGKARGIAQWHPDRQANFAKVMGKSLEESTLEDQLKFVDWELKNTEKSAGEKLRQATTAAEAAQIVDKMYERSSGAHLSQRIANAASLYGDVGTAKMNQAGPSGNYQSTVPDIKLFGPAGTASAPGAAAPTGGTDQEAIWLRLTSAMENLESNSQKQLNVNEKILSMQQ